MINTTFLEFCFVVYHWLFLIILRFEVSYRVKLNLSNVLNRI